MNTRTHLKERGQALVMIAIAALVLFAFTALTIDGGAVFSDRRHSQNASDTAVLAAALAKVQHESKPAEHPADDWQDKGKERAADNGYSSLNAPETVVDVQLCTTPITIDGKTFQCQGLPTYDANDPNTFPARFVYIVIKSTVHLKFAPILGWHTITNYTSAVSRATISELTNWYDGYGITSTHKGCWPNRNSVPFDLGGSGTTIINGAGVLVSAVCPTDNQSVNVSGNSAQLSTTTGVCAPGAGGMPANDLDNLGNPGLQMTCNVPPPNYYTMPAPPQCENAGKWEPAGNGVYTAGPGYYNSTFPPLHGSGQATIKITKGIYCLNDGIDVQGSWTLTTDLDGNGHEGTEGAFFYIPSGNVTFDAGANLTLHAITQGAYPSDWLNLLIYLPEDNHANIKITGNSGSTFTGTILAPGSSVTLQGSNNTSGGTVTLDSQIIGDTVKITGNTDLTIIYDENNNAQTPTSPGIALIK